MTSPADSPLKAAIIPVTAFQQNCTLLWCTKTMKGAFVDADAISTAHGGGGATA